MALIGEAHVARVTRDSPERGVNLLEMTMQPDAFHLHFQRVIRPVEQDDPWNLLNPDNPDGIHREADPPASDRQVPWKESKDLSMVYLVRNLIAAAPRLSKSILNQKLARRNDQPVHNAAITTPVDTRQDVDMAEWSTIDKFLGEISRIIKDKDAVLLQDFLVIEPPYGQQYQAMVQEARQHFTSGNEAALEEKCSTALSDAMESSEGPTWTAFVKFMTAYFCFLRDVNIDNLLDTYGLLSELVQKSNSAFKHPTLGTLLLPTVLAYSRLLSRLAIGLDKQPDLIAHLRGPSAAGSIDGESASETLPERAANIIRECFTTCLNDRAAIGDDKTGGRKRGIYSFANICLKILFSCKKARNAEQIFTNIYNQSPPLELYPRSQRVTYLYYLGRFLFSTNHFTRARLCLQHAYQDCHTQCLKQRRLILIYLIATSIIIGRFPTPRLLARPEANGLADIFNPITSAIAEGDIAAFRILTDSEAGGPAAEWMLSRRILLQIGNRCEVLVWRSLCRKTFILKGSQGDHVTRKAATLHLNDVLALRRGLEKRANAQIEHATRSAQTNGISNGDDVPPAKYIDPSFEGLYDEDSDGNPLFSPSETGSSDDETEGTGIDMLRIESMLSSLITQGLLNGFISHKLKRFAIQGAKTKGGPLAAGFPNPASVIAARMRETDEEVPGWRTEIKLVDDAGAAGEGGFGSDGAGFGRPAGGGAGGSRGARGGAGGMKVGPGMVINLSGARPAGVGP
ncbi:MAG: hypothetical protein M1828_003461 [Chrysothrix sp. TS-e1954]|nr:MAG: hypothetical protein M1828_003461 [Chrysothrix sp. TS-e1954]